jgi:hypothetical protein
MAQHKRNVNTRIEEELYVELLRVQKKMSSEWATPSISQVVRELLIKALELKK